MATRDSKIRTGYPHLYDAAGRRLTEPCDGELLILVPSDSAQQVHVRCDACGEGYRFEFRCTPMRKESR